jgi:small ubiquitin-related modifier
VLASSKLTIEQLGLKDGDRIGVVKFMTLIVLDQTGDKTYFKCTHDMKLHRLMNAYTERHGISADEVRFFFDGTKIYPDHTPRQLEMESGDVIDVMINLAGC